MEEKLRKNIGARKGQILREVKKKKSTLFEVTK